MCQLKGRKCQIFVLCWTENSTAPPRKSNKQRVVHKVFAGLSAMKCYSLGRQRDRSVIRARCVLNYCIVMTSRSEVTERNCFAIWEKVICMLLKIRIAQRTVLHKDMD